MNKITPEPSFAFGKPDRNRGPSQSVTQILLTADTSEAASMLTRQPPTLRQTLAARSC
jgi:hypothetical protein